MQLGSQVFYLPGKFLRLRKIHIFIGIGLMIVQFIFAKLFAWHRPFGQSMQCQNRKHELEKEFDHDLVVRDSSVVCARRIFCLICKSDRTANSFVL